MKKNISLSIKKKVKIESKWKIVSLESVCEIYQPKIITSQDIQVKGKYKVFGANGIIGYFSEYNHKESEIAITCRGATCRTLNFTTPKSKALTCKAKGIKIGSRAKITKCGNILGIYIRFKKA